MRVFSFRDVTAIIDAEHEVTGYATGDDVITAERNVDSATATVGAGGEMMLSVSADKSGKVTFKLLKTSSSNRYLLNRLRTLELGSSVFRPLNIVVQDVHRQDVVVGIAGYVTKPPTVKQGEKGAEHEWVLNFQRLEIDLGDMMGLGTPSSTVENLG
jgi:hypothetical protein